MNARIDERSGYTLGPDLGFAPLSVAARRLETTSQRLSRVLIRNRIQVHRMGFVLLIGLKDFSRLRGLLRKKSGRRNKVRRPL